MQATDALKRRRSVRTFLAQSIPANLIEQLIDCARFAPTARNIQPWEFIVVTEKKVLENFASFIDNAKFIKGCTCCIAVFCQDTKYYLEDGCAATVNILTAAVDLGLGACWVAGDKKLYCDKVKQILSVPVELKLVSLIALGFPVNKNQEVPKKTVKEILHWEKFRGGVKCL